MMSLGPRVRERRGALGLSQEHLAHQAGLSWGAIQRLEAGKITDPHYSTLEGIARALGTTVAELVGEEEPALPLDEAPDPRRPEDKTPEPRQREEDARSGVHMPETSGHAWHVQITEAREPTRVKITKTSFFELMQNVKAGRLSEEDAWQRFQEEAG